MDRKHFEETERQSLSSYGMLSAKSRGRQYPEEEHSFRLCFERDRDRIIHSTAFRRLEYKTQVFSNEEGDYYRTRLTHTMEAAQIARTVARALGLNQDLAEAIALAHDLGHTPFGHAGERVLADLMRDHGGFEHNAQSLRLVDVLEERYADFPGLNLSWEVREGIVKHSPPYDRPQAEGFDPGKAPCLEAQVVDYADEIAYNTHDIDDGLRSGILSLEQLDSLQLWRECYGRVRKSHPQAGARIWRYQAQRHLVDLLVSDLIDSLQQRITEYKFKNVKDIRNHGVPVVGFCEVLEEQRKELKTFLMKNFYRNYRLMRMATKARRIMSDLFESYLMEAGQLPPHILRRVAEGETVARVIADYIAGMTDRFAADEHRRLFDPHSRVL